MLAFPKMIVRQLLLPFNWLASLLPTRVRIVAALVAMVVVSFVLTMTLQMFPNLRANTMEGRASMTESARNECNDVDHFQQPDRFERVA